MLKNNHNFVTKKKLFETKAKMECYNHAARKAAIEGKIQIK
jgi:hypothetical protein